MYDLFNTGEDRKSNMELFCFFPHGKNKFIEERTKSTSRKRWAKPRGTGQTWFKL